MYVIEETHHTGGHAARGAPTFLRFGCGVYLGFVVSTTDLLDLSVVTICEEMLNLLKCL